MPSIKPVELDGSTLEGGGQLVRVALSLSAITGIPVHLYKIRANRAPHGRFKKRQAGKSESSKVEGGLKESHLAAVLYLAGKCNAYVKGAEVGSRELLFIPGQNRETPSSAKGSGKNVEALVDFQTNTIELRNPGSVWLILQALLPWLVFGNAHETTELILKGGTNVSKSMSGDYVEHVLSPILSRLGLPSIEVRVSERGWAGNASAIGNVHVRISRPVDGPFSLPAFKVVNRGSIEKIMVKIVAQSGFVQEELLDGLRDVISEHFGQDMPIEILPVDDSGDPSRLYLLLVACTSNGWRIGRDILGGRKAKNRSQQVEIIGNACQTVVRDLKKELKRGGCVDEFLQDQLVIFQALASDRSEVDGGVWKLDANEEDEVCGDELGSLHTRTVRWVCERMLKKQGIAFDGSGQCTGIGWNCSSF